LEDLHIFLKPFARIPGSKYIIATSGRGESVDVAIIISNLPQIKRTWASNRDHSNARGHVLFWE
jgi:hypothetical protein